MKVNLVVGKPLAQFAAYAATRIPKGTRIGLVTDAAVATRYGEPLARSLKEKGFDVHVITVPSGEKSKALAQAGRLYRDLSRSQFERKSWLIALGGGVVGDLTGFVAATFLRGIPFVQVPTTLLAQVDAAIGGKTGVDIPEGKNLVGAFYQPRWIWLDPSLLKSLPVAHIRNGLAEVIKYGAIRDAKLFALLEKKMDTLAKGWSKEWDPIIERCALIKAEVVQKDPLETKGLRAILNFGHTVGHAVEATGGYKDYLHGEAVSIGMFVASAVSQQMGLLEPIDRIRLNTLLSRAGLPAQVKKPIPRDTLMRYLARDKKAEGGTVRFVLLGKIGEAVSGHVVPSEILEPALAASGL